ncbi:MAG: hypothetical protein JWP75_3884 [Frondihabitans sp.]|nr:hypothetical protein [Frondihabitans sp.]
MPTQTPNTRLKGDKLMFTVGATTDYAADATNVVLTWDDADSGTVTFADAGNGGAFDATLKGTAIQSTDPASFWSFAWGAVGTVVPFKLAPWANAVPSVTQPHFTGNVKIGKRPDLGGDAQIDGDDYTFDFEWKVQGDVTKVTAAGS